VTASLPALAGARITLRALTEEIAAALVLVVAGARELPRRSAA
jgi:hypothetical protein